jgi:tetratricopeptide (TPR) repeat protein
LLIDDQHLTSYINIGSVYRDLGQRNKAYEALMKALEIDPEDEDAKDNLG